MRLAKRTRQRGAIFKMIAFAEGRAARISAAPPLPPARPPSAATCGALPPLPRVGVLARAAPWPRRKGPYAAVGALDALIVVAEGSLFGGNYELVEATFKAGAPPIWVSDAFLDPVQVRRAAEAGASGIAPIAAVAARAGIPLAEIAGWARRFGLAFAPECDTEDGWRVAAELEIPAAFCLSCAFDRDNLRPRALPLPAASPPSLVVALFAHDLPAEGTPPLPAHVVDSSPVDPNFPHDPSRSPT